MAGIELSLSYFGKKITIKNETPVLHAGELYNMFRSIMIAEFGEGTWNNLTEVQEDEINWIRLEDITRHSLKKIDNED